MGEKFRRFRRIYRHPDGTEWTGADIERATRGEVSRFYISRLRRGQIKDPAFSKIAAISRVMGIPLGEWTRDPPQREF